MREARYGPNGGLLRIQGHRLTIVRCSVCDVSQGMPCFAIFDALPYQAGVCVCARVCIHTLENSRLLCCQSFSTVSNSTTEKKMNGLADK